MRWTSRDLCRGYFRRGPFWYVRGWTVQDADYYEFAGPGPGRVRFPESMGPKESPAAFRADGSPVRCSFELTDLAPAVPET